VIYSLVVLNEEGIGEVSNMVAAVQWCIANQVKVINISAGFRQNHVELYKILKKAREHGITIISAAGNNFGANADYPARYPFVWSVGSVQEEGEFSAFSARTKVDLVVSQKKIKSVQKTPTYSTSLATAVVTGFVARSYEIDQHISRNQTRKKYVEYYLKEYNE
jgi:minor extracellular protease Epr